MSKKIIILITIAGLLVAGGWYLFLQQAQPTPLSPQSKEAGAEKIACEDAGGTYAFCPTNPAPNMGLCIPCQCPQGFDWSFSEKACVGN